MVDQEVTVAELKELYDSKKYNIEIDTPDGFQSINNWFDKGYLSMVKIGTENYQTRCAFNHMIQDEDGNWLMATEINVGDSVLTVTGPEEVILKEIAPDEECYDFEVGHENHRYWGDGFSSHNSGKSFMTSGNIVKAAQDQGIFVVLIDSENALDESWLKALDVDTDDSKLLKLNMAMLDDVAKTISMFMDDYRNTAEEDRPKVLFVIDSLGMMMTPTEVNQFDKGDMKGDMGRKAKALKALVMNCVNMFGSYNVGLVATNHTYASQDMFDPDDKISGGQGFIYASSIVVAMRKLKLKEDADGNKTSKVHGIRAACKVMKTRYSKPFESVQIKIPYESGMDPYSGMFDMLLEKGLLEKQGNRYKFITADGTEILEFQKKWTADKFDIVMKEISDGLHESDDFVDDEEILEDIEAVA